MRSDRWALTSDPDAVARLVRALDASVNVAILRELARARRRGDGWLYLSQIAARLHEAPGTIGQAVEKLAPFVEERREKGLRYFRARVVDVVIETEAPSASRGPPRARARPRRAGGRGSGAPRRG